MSGADAGGAVVAPPAVSLVVAILPVVPGFINAATTPGGQIVGPTFFDHLYTYAWFVTFALSFALYLVLHKRNDA